MSNPQLKTQALLKAALALVRRGWCQKVFARRADGMGARLRTADSDAVAWCPVGALIAAVHDTGVSRERGLSEAITLCTEARKRFCEAAGLTWNEDGEIYSWNDCPGRTVAEVEAVFVRAIDRAGDAS